MENNFNSFFFFFNHTLPLSSFIILSTVPDPDLGHQSGKPTFVFEGKVGDGRKICFRQNE